MRILVLALLGVVSTTYADPPKYTRKHDLHIDVKPSARVKPIEPKRGVQAPVARADDLLAIEMKKDPIKREQEAILVDLIRDTPDSDPDKPDYMFRLAEHYAKQLRMWRLEAVGNEIAADHEHR